MIGLVSTEPVADWVTELAEAGLLVVMAGPHVIRFLPSLLVTKSEIDEALTKLEQILQKEGVV